MTSERSLMRVLVVDDNRAFAENLGEILVDADFDVQLATSCAEARTAAATGIDVALVDLKLPDGDGLALASELKERCADAEIVLLTGFASVESAAAAIRAGACAYLVKPCATPELLLTVGQAARQVRLHQEKRDLARRARTAEKLAAVGTLTAGLSHEIRNPLNAAGLQLAVLERRLSKIPAELQPPLLEPLTLVRDEIRRLDHILEDFLQFARPRELVTVPLAAERMLRTTVDLLGGDADRRGIVLELDADPSPAVAGDEVRLRQVFMNLALNALEATPRGGHVRISLVTTPNEAIVRFDDDGPGIPDDIRGRLFEPFFTTKAQGSGLGLAIVHAIIEQHSGTIAIETSDAGGARFTVRLPLAR